MKVNLGCGNRKKEGFVNVDWDKECKPDIIADLNVNLPFKDNEVDEVYCSHIIEHVDDIFHFMYEIWRVCKPKALVKIIAPHFQYTYWSIQPDHKRFIRPVYFQYWDPKPLLINPVENYSKMTKGAKFKTIEEGTLNEFRELFFKLEVYKNE